jgi:hypothetical protein
VTYLLLKRALLCFPLDRLRLRDSDAKDRPRRSVAPPLDRTARRKLLPPRRRAWPRGLEGAQEQGDDGRLPEKVPLVRELGDRFADVADADINYLRRGGLGGGGVAGRRRSRLGDLQEHHGVEHAGGVGGAKRLLPKARTVAGVLPFSAREGVRGRERAGEHDADDGERPGHGVHRRSYTLQTQSLTPSCPSTVISVAVRRATALHHRVHTEGESLAISNPRTEAACSTLEQPQMSFANPRCGNLSTIFRRNLAQPGVSAAWRWLKRAILDA